DFSTDFDPEAFEPEDDEEEEETGDQSDVDAIISDVVNTYVDNFFAEIENRKEAMADATEEESIAAREEFVEKESEAMAGLVNLANNASSEEGLDDETIKQSVNAVLGSDVCMNTVTQTVENNSAFTEKVQEATQSMNEETKAEVQSTIESALENYRQSEYYDPAKEQQYSDLANLFGITLGNGMLPAIP
ncbi:MAG: hypothetical protein J6S44_05180, partial [Clostridia bacterium]|nr:hypothetical protein [Clostridia bacterium]